jgi:putative acetyltransferase
VIFVELRAERREDRAAVRELHLAAFGDHGRVVADLVDGLRESVTTADGLSLIAQDAGEVIGHVMFTRSLLDAPPRLVEVQVLSPVAVLPERQGQGFGSALIRRGLQVMAERYMPVVFLEGDRRATRATTRAWVSRPARSRVSASRPCEYPTRPSSRFGSRPTGPA